MYITKQLLDFSAMAFLLLTWRECMAAWASVYFLPLAYMVAVLLAGRLVRRGGGFHEGLVAFLDVVFTYGGQVNWLRYISQMRTRSHFQRVAGVSGAFMTAVYAVVGTVGYQRLGFDFDHTVPITSVLPADAWTAVANAGVLLHCVRLAAGSAALHPACHQRAVLGAGANGSGGGDG